MDNIYQAILEETLAGYWIWDIPRDALFLSPAFKAMFGYQDHELPSDNKAWKQLIVPEDLLRLDIILERYFQSQGEIPFNAEVRFHHKNGSIIWVNTTGRVIEWNGNEPIRMVGCHIDITQRKITEQEHKISEETFRRAFESSAIGMALVSPEGLLLKANKSLCDMLGFPHEELRSKTFQELTYPDDLEADITLFTKLLNREIDNYQMEKRYIRKNGEVMWAALNVSFVHDAAGKPLYTVSQVRDITERKNAEIALRDSERRWKFALEGAGDGLWDWDMRYNKIFHSRQCSLMIGLNENELSDELGEWSKRVHPDDMHNYMTDLDVYLEGKTEIYSSRYRVKCKDGSYKWVLDRGKIMEYDQDGSPVRMIGTHTDITDQKNNEEQLKQTLDVSSEQNNKLLNFAYIVSHNLRTHSSNFKMIMDLMAEPHVDELEKAELTKHLARVSEQLNDTITHLNEVVSIQTNSDIQLSPVNLREYADRAIDILSSEIKKSGAHVTNNVAIDVIIQYNPAYLESILFNLISNAIKYRSPERVAQIAIDLVNYPEKPVLLISDNGVGIDLPKNGGELFGMYKTFHGNRDAQGMGLFITKNQVESHGGKIEVESQPGSGTTFKLFF